ncbi:tetratricopeptide repeat protein [Hypnocyclicus thermotrophus]|nr:tetratricopeptide repeat protein [Hypnocyclicus thermotrophus]
MNLLFTDEIGKTNNYISIGSNYLEEQQFNEAIKNFEKALIFDDRNKEVYFLLGYSYQNLNKYKKALSFYNKAVKLGADDGRIYYGIAECYSLLMDKEKLLFIIKKL